MSFPDLFSFKAPNLQKFVLSEDFKEKRMIEEAIKRKLSSSD
jgi:hypothetical protein